jgi:hypothetical protein
MMNNLCGCRVLRSPSPYVGRGLGTLDRRGV